MPAEPTNEPTPEQRDEAAVIVRTAAAGRITLPVEASLTRNVAHTLAARDATIARLRAELERLDRKDGDK